MAWAWRSPRQAGHRPRLNVLIRASAVWILLVGGCDGVLPVAPAPAPVEVNVLDQGAVGDGIADDGPAIQRILDSLEPGSTVVFPEGHVFRHGDVLRVDVPRTRLTGGGTLLASSQERSSVVLGADAIEVDDLRLSLVGSTRRWVAYEQMKLRIAEADGVRIRNVEIEGAAAAGLYVGGATDFEITDVHIRDTRADGLHITESSSGGTVANVTVQRSGDDGIAVVSYRSSAGPCRDIVISDAQVSDQLWGRSFSVVGGTGIRFARITSLRSSGAALYLASEGNYNTEPATDIQLDGATFIESNTAASVDHGAVLMYNGQPGTVNGGFTLRSVVIESTRPSASRQVGIVNATGAAQQRIDLVGFTISGGPATSLWTNGPKSAYRTSGWIVDGVAQPAHAGW